MPQYKIIYYFSLLLPRKKSQPQRKVTDRLIKSPN